ncbi:hypothetical protein HU200_037812 [Digitaria exilis]|uniref:BHLH domain-containing protein n=1 Tax=Digitaria exilis TaxID=1010633 RepID=A0A835BCZ6_9POAL|nr:hypothetical protein HU200_037812 [Digitaria exilis]
MALEAVVLSQQQGSLFVGCGAMAGVPWNGLFGVEEAGVVELSGTGSCWESATPRRASSMLLQGFQELAGNILTAVVPSPVESGGSVGQEAMAVATASATAPVVGRRKRRRARAVKNKEEVESQRMTHIAVERNRRKQMNDYLAVLRSLMPPSYAQRGDQASIVGGAINFVKELEQLLQSLEARRRRSSQRPSAGVNGDDDDAAPFTGTLRSPPDDDATHREGDEDASGSKPPAVADVEATMVESHANLRVLSRRRPRQLLRLVVGLQGHRLTVLHLNMSSSGQMVLYSFSLKVEDDCQLTSVDEIAAAAHQILETTHQEQQGCSLE